MKKPLILVGLLLVFAVGCAHHTTAPVNPANQPVIIDIGNNMAFSPATVTVRSGQPIYWRNNNSRAHRIVLDDNRYDSSDIAPGTIGCGLILTDTGTHTYHDMNMPSMTGTITVTQ